MPERVPVLPGTGVNPESAPSALRIWEDVLAPENPWRRTTLDERISINRLLQPAAIMEVYREKSGGGAILIQMRKEVPKSKLRSRWIPQSGGWSVRWGRIYYECVPAVQKDFEDVDDLFRQMTIPVRCHRPLTIFALRGALWAIVIGWLLAFALGALT